MAQIIPIAEYPERHNNTSSACGNNIVVEPVQITPSRWQRNDDVHVSNMMCFAIFNALFCCLCLGIPAIILSNQANNLKTIDPEKAQAKSETARILNIMGVALGIIIIITAIVIYFRLDSLHF